MLQLHLCGGRVPSRHTWCLTHLPTRGIIVMRCFASSRGGSRHLMVVIGAHAAQLAQRPLPCIGKVKQTLGRHLTVLHHCLRSPSRKALRLSPAVSYISLHTALQVLQQPLCCRRHVQLQLTGHAALQLRHHAGVSLVIHHSLAQRKEVGSGRCQLQ